MIQFIFRTYVPSTRVWLFFVERLQEIVAQRKAMLVKPSYIQKNSVHFVEMFEECKIGVSVIFHLLILSSFFAYFFSIRPH